MTDTSVIYLDSTMTGHPQLSGTAGTGIDVLSALVTGFNSKSPATSLTRSGTTATLTLNGHGFQMITTGVGPVIEISGVNEAGWNGRWRPTSMDSNTITFTVPNTLTTPATGTIGAKYAGADWSKPYTGTNKAVFRSAAAGSAFLQVDDSATREMRARGYSDMTYVDTGTNPFPTDAQVSGGLYPAKSETASGAERSWALIADNEMMVLCGAYHSTYPTYHSPLIFGRPISFKADDAYHDLIIGPYLSEYSSQPGYNNYFYYVNEANPNDKNSQYFAKAVTQDGGSVQFSKICLGLQQFLGSSGLKYPPNSDGGIRIQPIYLYETATKNDRGILPGIFQCPQDLANSGVSPGGFYSPTTGPQAGHTFLLFRTRASAGTNSFFLVDVTGSWR